MRVVVVHNRYSSRVPSGENLAVDDEARWLGDAGLDVLRHEVANDDLVGAGAGRRVRDGVRAVWSAPEAARLNRLLEEARPDVVHVHNLFPLLTGSVPAAAARAGVPVVWTVHNRRVRCVAGGNFRDGAPCHRCRPGFRLPGVAHACFADSVPASALVSLSSSLFRSTARRRIVALAISEHMRDWAVGEGGLAPERVRVKYNGVAGPVGAPPPPAERSDFVFAGRLSAYKGIDLLLDAWARADVAARLVLLGDGDLAPRVRAAAAADRRIEWVGNVDAAGVHRHLADARAVVVPSTWDEPFGRNAAEALAHGRPVITTGRGGLAEIVDDSCGWVTGADPAAMADAIRAAAASDDDVRARGTAGRARHDARFSPVATTAALVDIYDAVAGRRPVEGR